MHLGSVRVDVLSKVGVCSFSLQLGEVVGGRWKIIMVGIGANANIADGWLMAATYLCNLSKII